jgi:pimeloyl-ACP methyl ester carboxylesterase
LAATEACHRDLAATGADLSAYNSSESAADFADLRKVLGYAAWNVYGTSYGSYLAQTLMRDHPEGIRSVVLDVRDPATGEDIEVVIDGGAIVDWLRNQNYAVPLLRAVPDRIDGLAAGRPDAIAAIATDRASRAPPPGPDVPALGYGLAFGVSCRESYPFATPEDLAAAGREAFPHYPASIQDEGVGGWAYFNEDCGEVWKVPAAPEAMHQPVASSIPTLLISGSFDTLTSLAGAKAAAAKLSNATIISIPGVGHFVSPASPCAQAVIVSFLSDPDAPDTSCVGALTPESFTSPASP